MSNLIKAGFKPEEQTVSLVNSGAANLNGDIEITKIGRVVILTFDIMSHDSSGTPTSAVGVIPAEFRPPATTSEMYLNAPVTYRVTAATDGTILFAYRDWAGTVSNQTSSGHQATLIYVV